MIGLFNFLLLSIIFVAFIVLFAGVTIILSYALVCYILWAAILYLTLPIRFVWSKLTGKKATSASAGIETLDNVLRKI